MKSLYNYIISTNDRYNNKTSVDGKELILNTEITERDYEFVNRIGTVISTPINIKTPIKKGDQVIRYIMLSTVFIMAFKLWFFE